jgi:hypothetical protein
MDGWGGGEVARTRREIARVNGRGEGGGTAARRGDDYSVTSTHTFSKMFSSMVYSEIRR